MEYHRFPPEIRNMLYECAALPDKAEKVERHYKIVGIDGAIMDADSVQSFYIDPVNNKGRSQLFDRDITKVMSIVDELLSLVVPWILFTFDTPVALKAFAETFAAHAGACERDLELHIEFDFGSAMPESNRVAFASWSQSELPHGDDMEIHELFENWMASVQELPPTTHIHLVFPYFWRDFRSLRGLSAKTGLCNRPVSFRFPEDKRYPRLDEHNFFVAQTIAAIKGIEVSEQAGIDQAKRELLVAHGCRGFNLGHCPTRKP